MKIGSGPNWACVFAISGAAAAPWTWTASTPAIEDRVAGTFTNPQLWASHNDFVFQSGYIRRYLPGFTDKSIFTQERLERELPWKIKGFIGHGLEFARPFNISEETLAILTQTTAGKLYRASMLLLGLRRDTMDSLADPHQGGLISWNGRPPRISSVPISSSCAPWRKSGATTPWGTPTSSWPAVSSSG